MNYPPRFRHPVPLQTWADSKGLSQAKIGKHFGGFTAGAIQKMLANPNRDVCVYQDIQGQEFLCEVVKQDALDIFVEGRHADPNEIILVVALNPKPPLGSRTQC